MLVCQVNSVIMSGQCVSMSGKCVSMSDQCVSMSGKQCYYVR